MKKRNLFVTALAAMLLFNVGNVSATEPTTKNCKDGVVYTNYYFFSDMNVINGNDYYNKDYRTEGNYTSKLLGGISPDTLVKTMNNTTGADEKLLYKKSQIQIVGDTESADGLNKMKLTDFWTLAKNKTDQTDGNKYYAVTHSWSRVDNAELINFTSVDLFRNFNINQLVAASLKIKGDATVSFVDKISGDFVFRVVRPYSTGTQFYGSSLTPISYENKQWALQPLGYYIQYCTAGDGIKNDAVTGNKNLPNNPKTGVATDVAAFTLVAAAAVTGLVIARKKGLFRQL